MKPLKKQIYTTFFALFIISQLTFAQFGKANKVQIPANYDFTWIVKMEMKTKKHTFGMDYYMKEDTKYFGIKNDMLAKQGQGGDIFMVMDIDLEVTSMFMEMMGKKIIQKTSIKGIGDTVENDDSYTYEKIGSKTILGYHCDGFKAENDEHSITFYVSNEVPVSFTQLWDADKKTMPKGFNTAWMKKYAENGAVLEMQFDDKKKSKNNMIMTCTGIEKTDFSIKTTDYKSMF